MDGRYQMYYLPCFAVDEYRVKLELVENKVGASLEQSFLPPVVVIEVMFFDSVCVSVCYRAAL